MPGRETPRQQGGDATSLRERMDTVQALAFFPALTLIVFTRARPGFRTLNGLHIAAMALVLGVLGGVVPGAGFGDYAWLLVTTGFWKRHRAWRALKRGDPDHSRTFGASRLERLPFVPPFLRADNRLARLVEPLLMIVAAWWLVLPWNGPLGLWLIFSGLCLRVVEQTRHDETLAQALNTLDGVVDSQVHEANVGHFTGDVGGLFGARRATAAVTGTDTGVADDIAEKVAAQRRDDS